MSKKNWLWYKLICLALALALIVPVLAACGGEEGEETPTSSPTPTVTVVPTVTPTSTPNLEPVKIGIIQDWSGPTAMSGWLSDAVSNLMEWYVKKQGGILGGRPIKFIKYDNRGTVAESTAGAIKLIRDDKVTIITEGGATTASFFGVADASDPLKVPYVEFGTNTALLTDYKWTATTISTEGERADLFCNFILNTLKPQKFGILAQEMADGRAIWDKMKPRIEAAGVKIVFDEWVQPGTMDLMSYLTKMKRAQPDVLMSYLTADTFTAMFKQIEELGGWGGIQNFIGNEHGNSANITKLPAAQGSYSLAAYIPGSDDPGIVAFEKAWADRVAEDPGFGKKYSTAPLNTHSYYWNCYIVAIEAIKLAGSDDPAKVAEALRSGKVEADTAFGHMRIQPDGSAGVKDHIVQIKDGKLVLVN